MEKEPFRTKDPDALMNCPNLDSLDAEVRETQSKEAYHSVSSGNDYRLGVVVTVSPDGEFVYAIELILCVFTSQTELEIPIMERAIRLTKELKERGYTLIHEDDGWISCTKLLGRNEVGAECGALMNIVMVFMANKKVTEKKEETMR